MSKTTAVGLAGFLAISLAAQSGTALAQEQQSFKSLMGKGFEIKSVTFVKGEATSNREVFVISMQREKSVAVCYFAATSWINLTGNSLDDPKRCDVR